MSHPITMDREIAELYDDCAATLTPDNLLEVALDGLLHPQHVADSHDMIRALCDEVARLRGVLDESARLSPMERLRRALGDSRLEVHVEARDGAGAFYLAGQLGAKINVDRIRSTVADRTVWELPQGRIVVGVGLPSVLDELAAVSADLATARAGRDAAEERAELLTERLADSIEETSEVGDARAA